MRHHLYPVLLALLAILLVGCPPEPGDDDDGPGDDDSAAGDDDTSGDDDVTGDDDTSGDDDVTGDDDTAADDDTSADDDTGDDDVTGDDDTGDDDTTGAGLTMTGWSQTEELPTYHREQDLVGQEALNGCPGCEFTFDITYTTTAQGGTCVFCWDLDDGVHTLGYDGDYMYYGYGPYEVVLYDDATYGWLFWYTAYAAYGGHDVALFFYSYYYGYTFDQYAYWDITGGVDADGDGYSTLWDCNDADPATHPGAAEVCDGYDNDCDPATDDTTDADGDGFSEICDNDCDDTDDTVYPSATELCDGLDNDCDGSPAGFEIDADGDGYLLCGDDCDDTDPAVHPFAPELCNGVDDDCDGVADNGCGGGLTGVAETIESDGTPFYFVRQDLSGVAAATNCPGCEYTYDITYTTTLQNGSCLWCWDLADGVHTLGYDADYIYAGSPYEVIFYEYGGSWNFWYNAYAGYGGHDVAFFYYTYYLTYSLNQYGYWDL